MKMEEEEDYLMKNTELKGRKKTEILFQSLLRSYRKIKTSIL